MGNDYIISSRIILFVNYHYSSARERFIGPVKILFVYSTGVPVS